MVMTVTGWRRRWWRMMMPVIMLGWRNVMVVWLSTDGEAGEDE